MTTGVDQKPALCKDVHNGTCEQEVSPPDYSCIYLGHNAGTVHVVGQAGRSVKDMAPKYGQRNANIGLKGEEAVSRFLKRLFQDDPAIYIFEDVHIPDSRYQANADFVVLRGNNILIIDAKVWPKGFYWSWRGIPYRGNKIFAPAVVIDKTTQKPRLNRTLPLAKKMYMKRLSKLGRFNVETAYLVAPPHNDAQAWKEYSMWALRLGGANKWILGNPGTPRKIKKFMFQGPPNDNEDAIRMFGDLVHFKNIRD